MSEQYREKLTNLGMQACSDCRYDCEPPRRKMLCPSDVDQIIAKAREAVKVAGLTPVDIGDNLDLEVEAKYPCSDGSTTWTLSVDNLLKAQTKAILRALGGE